MVVVFVLIELNLVIVKIFAHIYRLGGRADGRAGEQVSEWESEKDSFIVIQFNDKQGTI